MSPPESLAPSARPPIFVGGAPRSGTTLLRVILDSHPSIACGMEIRAVPTIAQLWARCEAEAGGVLWENYGVSRDRLREMFAGLVWTFLRPGLDASGKPRVAEKTPNNLWSFPLLRMLFPESPLIHVIRDGRDVVASRLSQNWKKGDAPIASTARDAAYHATIWIDAMKLGRRMRSDPNLAQTYIELRYEELIADPKSALEPIFAFIGEPWSDDVLRHHEFERPVHGVEEWSADQVQQPINDKAVARWRRELSPEQIAVIEALAGPDLRELGYLTS